MCFDQVNEIPLRIAAQGRLAEVGIPGDVVLRLDIKIGEVAPAPTGHEDLFAWLVGFLQDQYTFVSVCSGHGAHQTSGTSPENNDLIVLRGIRAHILILHSEVMGMTGRHLSNRACVGASQECTLLPCSRN